MTAAAPQPESQDDIVAAALAAIAELARRRPADRTPPAPAGSRSG